jgi:hypothetical protein
VTEPVEQTEGTLLKALIDEKPLTVPETLRVLEQRAKDMKEVGYSLSERSLRRWLAGNDSTRPGRQHIRVLECEFRYPIEALLAPDNRPEGERLPEEEPHQDQDLTTGDFINWVVEHSALDYPAAYRAVAENVARLATESAATRAQSAHLRSRVERSQIADAVIEYYGEDAGFYSVRFGQAVLTLSVLTTPEWVGLRVPLGGDAESCRLIDYGDGPTVRLSDSQAQLALERLARAEVAGTVMVNNPLYRLASFDVDADCVTATFGRTEFASYALTADLLETELRHLLEKGPRGDRVAKKPLRDAWLPTVERGLAFGERVCVGGTVCLVAIADGTEYHMLVQERSSRVVNVAGALAVIPKAFHQPLVDPFGETRISTTIEREMEEELLGRPDLEQRSLDSSLKAAPLHPMNASAPMQWLHEHPDAWRMECTGFGINMVTGNYELSCLVVIHDPTWWADFGYLIGANWEAAKIHRCSSVDGDGLERLVSDPRWSNEGLFAFLEGMRRLAELDPGRVRAPVVEPGR